MEPVLPSDVAPQPEDIQALYAQALSKLSPEEAAQVKAQMDAAAQQYANNPMKYIETIGNIALGVITKVL